MPLGKGFRLLPESASNFAPQVDVLFWFLTAVSVFMTLLLCVLVGFFAIRYRRRNEDEVPPALPPRKWLEISCGLGLLGVFMVIFVWGAGLYVRMKQPARYALEIDVIGKQWMWKIQHPGGQREINELHLPLGVPVKLSMTSQDVIHSFGLPEFRIKQDVVPGSYSTQWFTPTKAGEFHLFCQEYCGMNHSAMGGKVVVMEPKAFEAWLAGVPVDDSPEARGAKLFVSYGCLHCHGQVAPTLAGLYGRSVRLSDGTVVTADESYLRESILNPAAKLVAGYPPAMPSYRGQLSEEQVTALVAYIRSMGASRGDDLRALPDADAPVTRPVNGIAPQDAAPIPPTGQPPQVTRPPFGEKPQ